MQKIEDLAPIQAKAEAVNEAFEGVFFELTEKYYGEMEAYCQKLVDAGIDMADVVIQEYPITLVETDDPNVLRIQGRFKARFKTDDE